MRLHVLALLLAATGGLVLATGCDTAGPVAADAPLSTEGLTFTTDQPAYRSGAPIRVTLVNGSTAEATTGVLECATLERWNGRTWETSRVGNDRACIMIAHVIAPGRRLDGAVRVRVPAGSYRLAQAVTLDSGRSATVATGAFRIG